MSLRTGGTIFRSPDIALDLTYSDKSFQWLLNPFTGVAWTLADLTALQVGQQVST